jgi:hypothetical protein
VQVMPTSGKLSRIFGNYMRGPQGGAQPGTLSARLYLGEPGSFTLTPTSLVCSFTLLSSTTIASCSGTSSVTYAAGQLATIALTGTTVVVGVASISMAP